MFNHLQLAKSPTLNSKQHSAKTSSIPLVTDKLAAISHTVLKNSALFLRTLDSLRKLKSQTLTTWIAGPLTFPQITRPLCANSTNKLALANMTKTATSLMATKKSVRFLKMSNLNWRMHAILANISITVLATRTLNRKSWANSWITLLTSNNTWCKFCSANNL